MLFIARSRGIEPSCISSTQLPIDDVLAAASRAFAHGVWAAGDDDAHVDEVPPLELLCCGEAVGTARHGGAFRRQNLAQRPHGLVAGRLGETRVDVRAPTVEVLHVVGVEALRLVVGVGHHDDLHHSQHAVGVVVTTTRLDTVPVLLEHAVREVGAEVREQEERCVQLDGELHRLDRATAWCRTGG